jgi:hypothetical protein
MEGGTPLPCPRPESCLCWHLWMPSDKTRGSSSALVLSRRAAIRGEAAVSAPESHP